MNDRHYFNIFEEFKEECPGLVEKVERWTVEGSNSIRLYFNDGTKNVFIGSGGGFRPIHYNDGSAYDFKRDFCNVLNEKMHVHEYTQQSLANALGVRQSTIGSYLKRERIPKANVVAKMAELFNCTTDELINFRNR